MAMTVVVQDRHRFLPSKAAWHYKHTQSTATAALPYIPGHAAARFTQVPDVHVRVHPGSSEGHVVQEAVAAHGRVHLDLHAPLLGAAAAEVGQGKECAVKIKLCLVVFRQKQYSDTQILPLRVTCITSKVTVILQHGPTPHI
jgi:hypothetical protein